MSFDEDDLEFLKSIQEEEGFALAAKYFLNHVEKEEPEIAKDLREVVTLVLERQKYYNLEKTNADETKEIDYAAYDSAFAEWKEGEARLIETCESLFKKYNGKPKELQSFTSFFAVLVSLLPAVKNMTRENFFDQFRARREEGIKQGEIGIDDRVPGGVLNYLMPNPDPERIWDENIFARTFYFEKVFDFITNVNKVEFRPVLTAHPTNVFSGNYIQLLLAFAETAREVTKQKNPDFDSFDRALQQLSKEPMTPTADGLPCSFTPSEETDIELLGLENIYKNMVGPRRILDFGLTTRVALRKDSPDVYTPEDRLNLHINVKPKSWVMGDKDGNPNIKAEHLLRSVVARRRKILQLYIAEIQELQKSGIVIPDYEEGESWQEFLTKAEGKLGEIYDAIEKANQGMDIPLSQKDFNDFMKKSASVFGSEGAEKTAESFQKAIEGIFLGCSTEQQDELIPFIDRVRSFQFGFAPIELRETAEEYSKVIGFLLERTEPKLNYLALKEEDRIKLLDQIAEKPEGLQSRIKEFLQEIEETGDVRSYSEEDPRALVYHTLKRLELAAHHPDAVSDMILAECKSSSNLLEAVVLQKAVGGATNKPLVTPIIPLFEEFETLDNAWDILWGALETKAYRQHLLAVAKGDPHALELPVQIAHSDNNRRDGTSAARFAINDVHHQLRMNVQEQNKRLKSFFWSDELDKPDATSRISMSNFLITLKYFEGRSQTDSTRGGARAETALANLYNQHPLAWETFQGIDIFACLLLPEAFNRMVARILSHNAAQLADKAQSEQPETLRRIPEIERAVAAAFKKAQADYKKKHFSIAGKLFGHPLVNGLLNGRIYNRGCRSATRSGEKQKMPNAYGGEMSPEKMRAIAFGNNFLDAGIHPAVLSTLNIEKYLATAFRLDKSALRKLTWEAKQFHYGPVVDASGHLTPDGLQTLFNVSSSFRDVWNFLSIGCSSMALEHTLRRFGEADLDGTTPLKAPLKKYIMKDVPLDLAAASKFVLGRYGYALPESIQECLDQKKPLNAQQCAALSFLVRNITGAAPECTLNSGFGLVAQIFRDNVIKNAIHKQKGAFDDQDLGVLDKLAAVTLAMRHGRLFAFDDPHTGVARRRKEAQQQEKNPGRFRKYLNTLVKRDEPAFA